MAVRIITDSTSDISREEALQKGISLVPLKVIFGEETLRENVDIFIDEFYQRLKSAEKLPTTSQPSPEEFLELFQDVRDCGDSAVVLLISGELSGTVQSANIAKQMLGYEKIHIIDTRSSIICLHQLVDYAILLAQAERSAEDIVQAIKELMRKQKLLAMIDTLEYLHKGGRLSKTAELMGTLLKLKPLVTLVDGKIQVYNKSRGVNNAIAAIFRDIDSCGGIDTSFPVYLGYTDDSGKCELFKEKFLERYHVTDVRMYPIGCVVGAHVGPGAFAISYIKKQA